MTGGLGLSPWGHGVNLKRASLPPPLQFRSVIRGGGWGEWHTFSLQPGLVQFRGNQIKKTVKIDHLLYFI